MEQFSGESWSEKVDSHFREISEAEEAMRFHGEEVKTLEAEIQGTTGEERGKIYRKLTEAKAKLLKASGQYEDLKAQGGQNFKKAA